MLADYGLKFLLLMAFPLFTLPMCACQSTKVFVDGSTNNSDCTTTTKESPCNNLTKSLEFILNKSDSIVYITAGEYDLLPLSELKFVSVQNITLKGVGGVIVNCNGAYAGLTFIKAQSVAIQNVTFIGCGVEHASTSRNFSIDPELSLVSMIVSLYFQDCTDVQLISVTVKHTFGIAVQFYSTNGSNKIADCTFSDNIASSEDGAWGGGLYIEFPYCSPGNNSCDSQHASSVDHQSVSNSVYTIYNCTFQRNNASDSEYEHRAVLPYRSYHKASGRGGGLSLFFKGQAENNKINLTSCKFEDNHAIFGGGLYVDMQDTVNNNEVILQDVNFSSNIARVEGGGIFASFLSLKNLNGGESTKGKILLQDGFFDGNMASISEGKGGGISFKSTRQSVPDECNIFSVLNYVFQRNKASVGSATRLSLYNTELNGYLCPVSVTNVRFDNNSVATHELGVLGSGAMYINEVPVDFIGTVSFMNNYDGTALAAYHSHLNFSESSNISFENNTGHHGGALALHASSIITLSELVTVVFNGNAALDQGGAIYAEYLSPDLERMPQSCFFQYHDITTNPNKWNVSFTFQDNKSRNKTNSIFASSLVPCMWGQAFGVIPKSGRMQTMDDVFCWNDKKNIWNYGFNHNSNMTKVCMNHIESGFSKFDASSSPANLSVVPGNVTAMNLNGTDDQGQPMHERLIVHAYTHTKGVAVDEDYEYISSNNIVLRNYGNVKSATVFIDTVGRNTVMQTKINVSFLECPAGFMLSANGKCECTGTFGGLLRCDNANLTAYILRGFWIGRSPKDRSKTVVSHCKHCHYDDSMILSGSFILNESLDDVQKYFCRKHEEGTLCSHCTNGTFPAINVDRFNCVNCNKSRQRAVGVIVFIFADIVAPILFLIVLSILDVPLTNGLLHGPILFAQMLTSVITLDGDNIIPYQDIAGGFHMIFQDIITLFYDISNLEFLMQWQDYCLGFDRYAKIILIHYVSAFLPMILVFIVGFLYSCFDTATISETGASIKRFVQSRLHNLPNILATCILLSYTKVAVLSGYLLTPISLISSSGKISEFDKNSSVMYVDGTITYGSKEYISPYLVVSLTVSIFFLIPVPLFLILFRSNDPDNNSGFFNHLLEQFQGQFRQEKGEFDSATEASEGNRCCNRCNYSKNGACCVPLCNCCGHEFQNRTEYECECCTPGHLCRYYQMKARYCPLAIYTSFSIYDYRWFAGGFFVLRIALILPYMVSWTIVIRYCLQFTICMIAGIIILIVKPYKRRLYKYVDCNRVEAFSLFLLAFLISLCMYQYHYTTSNGLKLSVWAYMFQCVGAVLPLLWIILVYCVLLKKRHEQKLSCCCSVPDRPISNGSGRRNCNLNNHSSLDSIPLILSGRHSSADEEPEVRQKPEKRNGYAAIP